MASSKDTFEPNTFEANTFACGTFRGYGVTTVFTYPKILLTGNIQRNVAATGTAQRNIGVTGDRGANSP